jgi:hypothetical protein
MLEQRHLLSDWPGRCTPMCLSIYEPVHRAGKLADAEAMMALKDMMNRLNCNDTRHEALPVNMDADTRSSYIANSTVLGVDKADFILLIGTNPRVESPVYNARLRKMFLNGSKVRWHVAHFGCVAMCGFQVRAPYAPGNGTLSWAQGSPTLPVCRSH